MTDISLKDLRVFLVLAQELHFGRAAERLSISQSRLSESLKGLEARMGGHLFLRTSRSVQLTDFGRSVLERIKPAYEELAAGIEACRALAAGRRTVIRLGFIGGGLYELHQPFLREMAKAYPDQDLMFTELNYRNHFRAVLLGEVDLAFCRLPLGLDGLACGPAVLQNDLVLCVSKNHTLSRQTLVSPEDLAELRMCRLPPESANENWLSLYFPNRTPSGTPILPGPVVESVREGLAAAGAGKGSIIINKRAVDYFQTPDVSFISLDMPASESALVFRANDRRPLIKNINKILLRIAHEVGTVPKRSEPSKTWDSAKTSPYNLHSGLSQCSID